MLKNARIKNFGCLPNEDYVFASGLNVIIGENGLGKSHLLKLLYATLKVNSDAKEHTKTALQKAYADKLIGVFRPEALGRLVKRRKGLDKCEVALAMHDETQSCAFSFSTKATSAVQIEQAPSSSKYQPPAYIPTRELVTLCPWFVPLYDNYHLRFEESWRDTVSLLGAPSLKGPREKTASDLLKPLEEAMGGKVVVDAATGEFYLQITGEGKMEMPLVAEGLRKLAMLARLISTGVLLDKGYLFWDEPETNLNPKLVKVLARCIMHLCKQGIQVFLATHSLFLMRELEMLVKEPAFRHIPQRYFALKATPNGAAVEQANSSDAIQTIVMLDEELHQSDRFVMQEG
ncbi:ATP/GTP-binding protein [Hydrogenophaga sp.]|uniref:AAA family ATPase n=1 Tax=Hydrogenophaga sp. TaxID=1904254 RepID=UPI0027196DF2|nr:AAA family ATPase [Hydrogenophaga sp.]MDO9435046.1 AAA family ATPase [Hydrogenophaga sp.]